jgi:hypothetical protein
MFTSEFVLVDADKWAKAFGMQIRITFVGPVCPAVRTSRGLTIKDALLVKKIAAKFA